MLFNPLYAPERSVYPQLRSMQADAMRGALAEHVSLAKTSPHFSLESCYILFSIGSAARGQIPYCQQ